MPGAGSRSGFELLDLVLQVEAVAAFGLDRRRSVEQHPVQSVQAQIEQLGPRARVARTVDRMPIPLAASSRYVQPWMPQGELLGAAPGEGKVGVGVHESRAAPTSPPASSRTARRRLRPSPGTLRPGRRTRSGPRAPIQAVSDQPDVLQAAPRLGIGPRQVRSSRHPATTQIGLIMGMFSRSWSGCSADEGRRLVRLRTGRLRRPAASQWGEAWRSPLGSKAKGGVSVRDREGRGRAAGAGRTRPPRPPGPFSGGPVEAGGDDRDLDHLLHRRSMTVPKMMLASGWASLWISWPALETSWRVRSLPPVMLIRTPLAPSIEVSMSSGLRDGLVGRLGRPVLARGDARAHEGHAHALHDRLDVGEVEVDEAGPGDQVARRPGRPGGGRRRPS